ncbi:hypothetical protein [Streptococcus ovuberis]|uniref:Uncharacterized protein n=1 Tax=Streptococcus ovuberis TaxID=1936207 RepID=A0A7X6MZP0_9STRE|nr:hypothetical protein [Streptococcus ovuberis]NKZ20368.1 hypothetical protein [Streptococcus ovuberis]
MEKDGSQRLLDRLGKRLESKPNLTEEEKMSADMDAYIFFCNHEQFQECNNGLAPLEMRNKAVA